MLKWVQKYSLHMGVTMCHCHTRAFALPALLTPTYICISYRAAEKSACELVKNHEMKGDVGMADQQK